MLQNEEPHGFLTVCVSLRCSGNSSGAVKIFELQQLDYYQGVYCLEEHLNLGPESLESSQDVY